MNAKLLKPGMKVKFANGNIVKVTSVPSLDKYGECFFSGTLIATQQDFYKPYLNKELKRNWNSAFAQPV